MRAGQVERLAKFMQMSERLKELQLGVLRECARSVRPEAGSRVEPNPRRSVANM